MMETMQGQGYLTTTQAAGYLGVSESLIQREFRAGRLAGYKPLRGVMRFHRDDLDAWIRGGRVEATQPLPAEQAMHMAPIQARRRSAPRKSA